eukprot:2094528-Rhodomonas_salina.1
MAAVIPSSLFLLVFGSVSDGYNAVLQRVEDVTDGVMLLSSSYDGSSKVLRKSAPWCYEMSGTQQCYAATRSGTYGFSFQYARAPPSFPMALRVCYGMSGTDLGPPPASLLLGLLLRHEGAKSNAKTRASGTNCTAPVPHLHLIPACPFAHPPSPYAACGTAVAIALRPVRYLPQLSPYVTSGTASAVALRHVRY